MASELKQGSDIEGLHPAIDRRKMEKPYVVDGRNFLFDINGPYSGFGNRIVTYAKLADPISAETFRVEDETFIATNNSMLKYDNSTGNFYPVYIHSGPPVTEWPWSHAEVGGKHYFANYNIGLLEWDPATDKWRNIVTDTPTSVRYVCASYGRLIVLGSDYYHWSAFDDGADLALSVVTGAGRQGISIISGTAYGLAEVSEGFLVFTSKGIVNADHHGSTGIFTHEILPGSVAIRSPFDITTLDRNRVMVLELNGFYAHHNATQQQKRGMFPYEPIMGQWFERTLFSQNQTLNTRLYYDDGRQLLFVSVAPDSDQPYKYEYAYVLHIPTKRWGVFNQWHYGFGELYLDDGPFQGYNFGYIDTDGYMRHFNEISYIEGAPSTTDTHYYAEYANYPLRIEDDVYYFPTLMDCKALSESEYTYGGTGLYELSVMESVLDAMADPIADEGDIVEPDIEDWMVEVGSEDWMVETGTEDYGTTPVNFIFDTHLVIGGGMSYKLKPGLATTDYDTLDAWCEIGMFRFSEAQYNDELGMVTNVSIGMNDNTAENATFEDWMDDPDSSEDWMLLTAEEDYGEGLASGHTYDATIKGYNDGETLFTSATLTVAHDEGATKFFTCTNTAIFNNVHISAEGSRESFHLKFLELAGTLAGRL